MQTFLKFNYCKFKFNISYKTCIYNFTLGTATLTSHRFLISDI